MVGVDNFEPGSGPLCYSLRSPRLKRKSRRVTSSHFSLVASPNEHEMDLSKTLISDMTLKKMNFKLDICICLFVCKNLSFKVC